MPTGYTHPVQEGKITELRDFALNCARAFGACVTMRDDPSDTPIPGKFEPSDYHIKALKEAKEDLLVVRGLDDDECEHRAKADYENEVARRKDYRKKHFKRHLKGLEVM